MMAEIQEIGELISPRIFGKPYSELSYYVPGSRKKEHESELFHCCVIAQNIRLDAMKSLELRFPGVTHRWEAILMICEEMLEQPGRIELQKKKLREKGFLQ